jgi:hypothetical protein
LQFEKTCISQRSQFAEGPLAGISHPIVKGGLSVTLHAIDVKDVGEEKNDRAFLGDTAAKEVGVDVQPGTKTVD